MNEFSRASDADGTQWDDSDTRRDISQLKSCAVLSSKMQSRCCTLFPEPSHENLSLLFAHFGLKSTRRDSCEECAILLVVTSYQGIADNQASDSCKNRFIISPRVIHKPPCIAKEDKIRTRALMIPHEKGIHVDMPK